MLVRRAAVGKTDIEFAVAPAGEHIADGRPEKFFALAEITVADQNVFFQSQKIQSWAPLASGTEFVPEQNFIKLLRQLLHAGQRHGVFVDVADHLAVHHHQVRTAFQIGLPDIRSDLRSSLPIGKSCADTFNNGEKISLFVPGPHKGDGSFLFAGTGEDDLLPVNAGTDLHRVPRLCF